MKKYFKMLYHEIRMSFCHAKAYKFSFILDVVIFFGVLAFVILSDSGYKLSIYYKTEGLDINFKELLLIAYALWTLVITTITALTSEIRMENMTGTLEYKFMSVMPFEFLLIIKVISSLLIQLIETIIILLLAWIIFGIHLNLNLKIIFIMLITYIGMYGFSLAISSIVINKKKIGQLTLIIQILLLFVSNVFTISKINLLSRIIPLGIGNHIIRLIYVSSPIESFDILNLILTCFIWLVLGELLFRKSVKNAKVKGSLAIY